MTNRTLDAPFLAEPPIYDEMFMDGELSSSWFNWFNSVTRVTGYIIIHDRFDVSKEETVLLKAPELTETQRNDLQSAPNGTIIYNTTSNRFNFRENGTWVTFTAVAA